METITLSILLSRFLVGAFVFAMVAFLAFGWLKGIYWEMEAMRKRRLR